MNCIFCKIANKEIKSNIIYEDQETLAFLDLSQTTLGHTLVIPKKHYDSVFDIEDSAFLTRIPMIAKHIKQTLNVEGVNIVNNSGLVAGQSVNHVHFHIIPRYSQNDTFKINYTDNSSKISKQDLLTLKEKLEMNKTF